MSNPKRPELKLSGNISENFKNFETRFNDYCIQADYRNLDKDPSINEQRNDHYKKPLLELAALRSALPDEALQVVRYTIEPQISAADKNKPWIWMRKLRTHYTGSTGSSLLSDRYQFWHIDQLPQESIQDWEVRVRQKGSLCEYGALHDQMCRDKFVFGLNNETIRTELLKTHLKADGNVKTLNDTVSEAKAYESAFQANNMMEHRTRIEEQVNWTNNKKRKGPFPTSQRNKDGGFNISNRKPHRLMKLRRQPGTCHWCGDTRGPHPWKVCPANGKTCYKCGGVDHLGRVCMENEQVTTGNIRQSSGYKTSNVNVLQTNDY